jgi:uncharacterized protein involved in propanediol utilization
MTTSTRPLIDSDGRRHCDRIVRDLVLDGRQDDWTQRQLALLDYFSATVVSPSHAGEFVQGAVRLGGLPASLQDGRLPPAVPVAGRFLIDLPAAVLASTVTIRIRPGNGRITTRPAAMTKASKAARLLLELLGIADQVDIEIDIRSNIPQGRGAGSSSADSRGTLIGICDALDLSISVELLDLLTVLAEGATNPAPAGPSLFFHRIGFTAVREKAFPRIYVLVFDDPMAPPVDTDRFEPAAYSVAQLNDFELLAPATLSAIRRGDANGLGKAAMRSAHINGEFLKRVGATTLPELDRIYRRTGAAGFAVSHSGTFGALLFDARDSRVLEQIEAGRQRLAHLGCTLFDPYRLGD